MATSPLCMHPLRIPARTSSMRTALGAHTCQYCLGLPWLSRARPGRLLSTVPHVSTAAPEAAPSAEGDTGGPLGPAAAAPAAPDAAAGAVRTFLPLPAACGLVCSSLAGFFHGSSPCQTATMQVWVWRRHRLIGAVCTAGDWHLPCMLQT